MKSARNSQTAFRFGPTVKDALSSIAERNGRSIANMIEWLIKAALRARSPGMAARKREELLSQAKTARAAIKTPTVKKK